MTAEYLMADAEIDLISNESSDFTEEGLSELSESERTLFLFEISEMEKGGYEHVVEGLRIR